MTADRYPIYLAQTKRIAALEERIAALEREQTADHAEMLRRGTRIARLEAAAEAAQAVVACVIGSACGVDPPTMMTQVCRVLRRTTQFERLERLLGETSQ